MLAIRRATIFANELGFKDVCFEGNAEGVVRSIREEDSSNALMGHLVKDFKSIAGLFQTQKSHEKFKSFFVPNTHTQKDKKKELKKEEDSYIILIIIITKTKN